ncbi:MAG: transporter [Saprospiraceae bacterium]|nr:transporter [Saprospiraceae bacterium]
MFIFKIFIQNQRAFLRSSSAFLLITLLIFFIKPVQSQTPSDAIMMKKMEFCGLLSYTNGQFNRYWEGDLLRKNKTIQTVHRQGVMPMVAFGVNKWLNVYAGLPYIWTYSSVPNGGYFAGASGFQDFSLAVKAWILEKSNDKGRINLLSSLSLSTPATKYLGDYLPYSLGLGDQQILPRLIAEGGLAKGPYVRASWGYQFRGYSKAERDYHYNNGSVYSYYMDVPGAWVYDLTLGTWLFQNQLKFEAAYMGTKSTSGDDIRPYNAPQPTNRTEIDQYSLLVHFYPKQVKGAGIVVQYNDVIRGRNAANMTSMSVGLTYQFSILKQGNQ